MNSALQKSSRRAETFTDSNPVLDVARTRYYILPVQKLLLMARFYDFFPAALAEGQPFALGIISGIKGSSPQKKGAKALFYADGRIQGTLGGGCLEAEIQDRARRALLTEKPATFELVLDHDFGWDDGLICGGKVCGLILPQASRAADIWQKLARCDEPLSWGVRKDFSISWVDGATLEDDWLYRETVSPPCAMWIAGSGHVAQAIAPLALQLDLDVTVFDDRPSLANAQYFPKETKFRVDYWEQLFREPLPARPAIEDGLATAEQVNRVACPVGLDIQAVSVPEIAVSVMAQLIQKRAEITNTQRPSVQSQHAATASAPNPG